ncbi:hypothetical protein BANRA_04347 [Klebsiella pneumoniae]|nr:hypothetical protein BANRA_04347 [Klebsiella pneumoniae]
MYNNQFSNSSFQLPEGLFTGSSQTQSKTLEIRF